MARLYPHVERLAAEINQRRQVNSLTYEGLASRAGIHLTTAFRVCQGNFKTLNPGVLRICKALNITLRVEGIANVTLVESPEALVLQTEVLEAWDRSDRSYRLIRNVLRALRTETPLEPEHP